MEKTDEINPNVYAKVKKIIDELHDPVTGFKGLQNSIASKLSRELPADKLVALKTEYETTNNMKLYIRNIVLQKINEFESSEHPGVELTTEQRNKFETSVLNEIKTLLANPKEYATTHSLKDLDAMTFSLSGENIIKYRFYASCGNAADAFAYKNAQLGENRIPLTFLHSTRWNHLIDGNKGHTIPRIQVSDDKWVALDPQLPDVKFITSELKEGNKIEHLLKGHSGVPYMITEIGDTNYNNHTEFMEQASKVPYNKAKEFLNTISDNEVNPDELAKYKEQISQEYTEKMKKAVKDVKKLNQEAQNQQLQQAVYVNKNQND